MSLWRLNAERLWRQIKFDEENMRLTWKPRKLEDNIFELLGLATRILSLKLKGNPYKISENSYTVKVERK